MDHDRKVCPRCGEPTAGYGFCAPCRAHIDSLTGGRTPGEDLPTAQVLREVVRLEQALADASRGMSDRIGAGPSTAAVEVGPAAESIAEEAATGGLEIAKLPGTDDAPQRPDVARLEDVLTVVPRSEDHGIPPRTAAAAAEDTSVEATSVPPPEPTPRAEIAPTAPSYVAAHVLRAAFWFEQTSAFESRPDEEIVPELLEVPALDPNRFAATSVPPPSSAAETTSVPPPPQVEPLPAAEVETSQRNWITAACLLALIALVVVLTGRRPCRCDCHKSR